MKDLLEQNGIDTSYLDDLDAAFESKPKKPIVTTKKLVARAKKKIKVGSPEYNKFMGIEPKPTGDVVPCDEPRCAKADDGIYTYYGEKHKRTCHRCKGTGHYSVKAQENYVASRGKPNHRTWQSHNTNNNWGYIM